MPTTSSTPGRRGNLSMAYSRNNEKLFWEEETHLNPHRNLNSLISKKKKKNARSCLEGERAVQRHSFRLWIRFSYRFRNNYDKSFHLQFLNLILHILSITISFKSLEEEKSLEIYRNQVSRSPYAYNNCKPQSNKSWPIFCVLPLFKLKLC